MNSWIWEKANPDVAAAAGNFAKQFKNLQVKAPGIMALEEPSPDSVLIAREVIQNSWDSAAELRELEEEAGRPTPDFEIDFVFDSLKGKTATRLADAIALHEHQARVEQIGKVTGSRAKGRKALGLGVHDYLDDPTELNTLTIIERGTAGMHGPWVGRKSKMYLALVSVGFTQKHAGAGGSYGFGKAGLIRGSRIRTVIAYSCFRERDDDPGITRRLFGMTYWGGHEIEDDTFTGFARFGTHHDESAKPFENDLADEIAHELGLDLRDPDETDELGTTFLLVDSGLDPSELCSAIERNWWPALEDDSFGATVVAPDGTRLHPRPKKQPDLLPFVRAHELATIPQDSKTDHEFIRDFQKFKDSEGHDHDLGTVGILAETDGWSYPNNDNPAIDHRSLIALVRGPKMVVEYLECGGNVPFVRGTFVADGSVDDLLRQTEPPLHDAWDDHESSDDIDQAATEVAKVVKARIRNAVNDFRNQVRPPVPDKRDLQLDLLEELMGSVFDGKGNTPAPPPDSPARDISIRLGAQKLVASESDPTMVRHTGKATFSWVEEDADGEVAIILRYKFVEDGAAGTQCPLHISPPPGFEPDEKYEGRFIGRLGPNAASFAFETIDYDSDWSGQLSVEADRLKESA